MALFNIIIEHSQDKKEYIIAINNRQLDNIVSAYLNGESTVLIKGKKRNIFQPIALMIYSTEKWEGTQADLELDMRKQARLSRMGKLSLKIFQLYGTNITDEVTNGLDWGAKKQNHINNSEISLLNSKSTTGGKIFISHAVKDAEIVRAFTENILQSALGVNLSVEVFNISIEDSGIKSGEDFRKKIASELKAAKAVIQIITDNYKRSEACLNEMGAAWMLSVPVIPFILDPVTYSNVGFIHTPNQLLKLNSFEDLKKFVAENKSRLFMTNYDDTKLDRKINEFLNVVKNKHDSQFQDIENIPLKNALVENLKLSNPFYKINNHSNLYYLENDKYFEIPDLYTQTLLGYKTWNAYTDKLISKSDLPKLLGKPLKSVLNCEIVKSSDNPSCWILYNNYRHHILNGESLDKLIAAKKLKKSIVTIQKDKLDEFMQGDAFNLI